MSPDTHASETTQSEEMTPLGDQPQSSKSDVRAIGLRQGRHNEEIEKIEDGDSDTSSLISSSDDENGIQFASRLTREGLFQAYVLRLDREKARSPESAQEKSPQLIESFVDYVHSLESRIKDLESKLISEPKLEDRTRENVAHSRDLKCTVEFFPMNNEIGARGGFIEARDRTAKLFRSSAAPAHFIRVLYRWKGSVPASKRNNDCPPEPSDIDVAGIRIDSQTLSSFFIRMERLNVPPVARVLELYRPFRAIIRGLPEVRERITELEKYLSTNRPISKVSDNNALSGQEIQEQDVQQQRRDDPGAPNNVIDQTTTSPSAQETDLPQFLVFLETVEKYLQPQLELWTTIREGRCSQVSFQNLWMLFDYNDTIYCPGKRETQEVSAFYDNRPLPMYCSTGSTSWPQAFRVIHAIGGTSIGSYKGLQFYDGDIDREQDHQYITQDRHPMRIRDRFSSLVVSCFFVKSDAKTYGPCHDFFVFKPFEGEVDITSLEAYPIRFHHEKDKICQDLLDRGRKFIDMTIASHLNYEGLTIGHDKEEIVSPVIVDMILAYQENVRDVPKSGPLPRFEPSRNRNQNYEIAYPYGGCRHGGLCNPPCLVEASNRSAPHHDMNEVVKMLYDYEPREKDPKLIREEMKRYLEATNFLILLTGSVPGYALRNRKWFDLDVQLLEPVMNDFGWRDLVLPSGHKAIVQAMVENHAVGTRASKPGSGQYAEVDLVRGKGKGCIILVRWL